MPRLVKCITTGSFAYLLCACASYQSANFCKNNVSYDVLYPGSNKIVSVTDVLFRPTKEEADALVKKIPNFQPFNGVCWYLVEDGRKLHMSMGLHNNTVRYSFARNDTDWSFEGMWVSEHIEY